MPNGRDEITHKNDFFAFPIKTGAFVFLYGHRQKGAPNPRVFSYFFNKSQRPDPQSGEGYHLKEAFSRGLGWLPTANGTRWTNSLRLETRHKRGVVFVPSKTTTTVIKMQMC
ncbi:MAG: hypothetical protein CM15mP83_1790 [Flavobacteriaceae bacterium]|nr:MAG: hypothetical protein CM15mP83_1790 [Flavobacteriaceae bacterium]